MEVGGVTSSSAGGVFLTKQWKLDSFVLEQVLWGCSRRRSRLGMSGYGLSASRKKEIRSGRLVLRSPGNYHLSLSLSTALCRLLQKQNLI